MKLSEIKVDATAVESGQWIGDIPEMGNLRLLVRGLNNSDYKRMSAKLYAATPRAERPGGRLTPEAGEKLQARCLAATVLIDWDGLEDDNGPVAFASDLALKLLLDPSYAAFRDGVVWAATQVGAGRAEDAEEAAKNLELPSAGN